MMNADACSGRLELLRTFLDSRNALKPHSLETVVVADGAAVATIGPADDARTARCREQARAHALIAPGEVRGGTFLLTGFGTTCHQAGRIAAFDVVA